MRVRRLVEDHGDRPRPGERLVTEAIGLHRVGQVEHLGSSSGVRSSSRRKCRRSSLASSTASAAWTSAAAPRRRRPRSGSAAAPAGARRLHRVDEQPALARRRFDRARRRLGEHDRPPQPACPALPATSGLSIAPRPCAEVLAHPLDRVEQVLVGDRGQDGQRRGARRPGCRRRCCRDRPARTARRPRRGRCRRRSAGRRRAPWPG